MRKNMILGMCMFIILFASLAANINALGVAPSRELIPYDTQEHTFTVRALNNGNDDIKVAVYLSGELAGYATVDTNMMIVNKGEEKSFKYTVKLPEGLPPGQKTLDVVVAQVPDESFDGASTVNAGLIAIHQLKVDVPYPGQFADGELYVSNSKKGEPLVFTVSLINKGKDKLNAKADIVIKGPTNEQIKRFELGEIAIESGVQGKIEGQILNELNPGEYIAEAVVQYGPETRIFRKNFYSGDMIVDINSIKAKDFRLGTVAKFDIEIENKWNQPLDVYADMTIIDSAGNEIEQYKTGTSRINTLARDVINAYWDTEGIGAGNYNVKIILNYAGKTNERIMSMVVGIDDITVVDSLSGLATGTASTNKDAKFNVVIILLIVLIGVNIGWFVYFKMMRKPPNAPPQPPQANIQSNNQI